MIISIVGGGASGITVLRNLAELAASDRHKGAIGSIQLFDNPSTAGSPTEPRAIVTCST